MHIDLPSLGSPETYAAKAQSSVLWPAARGLNENASAKGRVKIDTAKVDLLRLLGGGEYITASEVIYIEHPA